MPEEANLSQSSPIDVEIVSDRPPESNPLKPDRIADFERISRIIAPYFTVLVGLYLYKSNFWLGFLFIGLGMLALLNVSIADIKKAIAAIKSFFGLQEL
ncbi:MAG: hypothetical protein J7647_22590 [Cyanobacteria bacterium SBLK]|nr:hypothetical protein [Cyanobacteria bacterium SBLK]